MLRLQSHLSGHEACILNHDGFYPEASEFKATKTGQQILKLWLPIKIGNHNRNINTALLSHSVTPLRHFYQRCHANWLI